MTTIVDLYEEIYGDQPDDETYQIFQSYNMLTELPELRGRPDKMLMAHNNRARSLIGFAYFAEPGSRFRSIAWSGSLTDIADALMVEDRVKWWAGKGQKDFRISQYTDFLQNTLRAAFKRRHDELDINLHIHLKDAFTGKDRVFAEDLFHLEFGPFSK